MAEDQAVPEGSSATAATEGPGAAAEGASGEGAAQTMDEFGLDTYMDLGAAEGDQVSSSRVSCAIAAVLRVWYPFPNGILAGPLSRKRVCHKGGGSAAVLCCEHLWGLE